jgi:ATP-binding cassette subfamily F protein 3
MLQISNLSYQIEGRYLFEKTSITIADGHKVGLVGRNGTGKSTLLALICGELELDEGSIELPRNVTIGRVTQEAPGDERTLINYVLGADVERARLLNESQCATVPERIAEIQLRLTDIRAHQAPARAAIVLAGLGFDEATQSQPLSSFSGGWRMRVALAALLFREPDLLLLDEPTNYLDLEGALWLEAYLRCYRHTVIIVSHDRDLLTNAVQGIIHLESKKLNAYSGGYDQFERQRRERQALQLKLKKRQETARRHMEVFVERFRAKATKARQAQSRLKALSRMEPIIDVVAERFLPFRLEDPEKSLPAPLVQFSNVSAGYGNAPVVLERINLRLDPDDRIGLIGANGEGKSTFAKLLSGKLQPLSGTIKIDRRAKSGYFAQHQLDELQGAQTPYHHMRSLMPDATESAVRARLGFSGFSADLADTKVTSLSGGERSRLLLATTTFSKPHLLILDEPTNHLDIDAREALALALGEYNGAVILISHDRHLIEIIADRLWLVANGTVAPFDGDLDDYRTLLLRQRRSAAGGNKIQKSKGTQRSNEGRRRKAAEARTKVAPLKRDVARCESKIDKLKIQLSRLDNQLSDGELYKSDPGKAGKFAQIRSQVMREIATFEEAWLIAAQAYEEARKTASIAGNDTSGRREPN